MIIFIHHKYLESYFQVACIPFILELILNNLRGLLNQCWLIFSLVSQFYRQPLDRQYTIVSRGNFRIYIVQTRFVDKKIQELTWLKCPCLTANNILSECELNSTQVFYIVFFIIYIVTKQVHMRQNDQNYNVL